MSHSDVQKYIYYKNGIDNFNSSCTGFHERLCMHYFLCLKMTVRVFLVEFPIFLTYTFNTFQQS